MQKLRTYYKSTVIYLQKWWNGLKEDRNVFVFMIFLFISTGIWFLNALQKEYTSIIEYPVKFTNIPKDYILKDSKTKELQLKVTAGGFNILRYYLSTSRIPLSINVSEMKELEGKGREGFYLLSSNYFKSINGQLSNGMKLLSISPDTLFIRLSPKMTRRLPITPDIDLAFKTQYNQAGDIVLEPDSVDVTGDAAIVDSLESVKTKHSVFKDLSDTLVVLLPLEKTEGLKYSTGSVTVTVPVEPFTESSIMIPVVARNVPDSMRLKTFPSEIKVSFRVSLNRFESINAEDFTAAVYFTPDLINNNNQRIKVKLERYPEGLYFVDYTPLFVEYLLEKGKKR